MLKASQGCSKGRIEFSLRSTKLYKSGITEQNINSDIAGNLHSRTLKIHVEFMRVLIDQYHFYI